MKKQNKKGFTVVELVIVIAVVAVLASVLIPTFASLIQRAKLSSDQVAVKNMNTILSAEEAYNGKPRDYGAMRDILADGGYRKDALVPLADNHKFYWDSQSNKILLVNTSNNTLYYPNGAEWDAAAEEGRYITLDGVPFATLVQRAETELKVELGEQSGNGTNPTGIELTMDTGVTFMCPEDETTESAQKLDYGDYYVDFIVTFSKKLTYDENNPTIENGHVCFLLLGKYNGTYGNYNWIPLAVSATAGTCESEDGPQKVRLLEEKMGGLKLCYYELPEGVQDFECGIKAVYDNNFGTTDFPGFDNQVMDEEDAKFLNGLEVTVDLCLFDPDTNEFFATVNTYTCVYKVVGGVLTMEVK